MFFDLVIRVRIYGNLNLVWQLDMITMSSTFSIFNEKYCGSVKSVRQRGEHTVSANLASFGCPF